MPLKLNIGLSRKVGEAHYGSRGASINLEVELESSVLNDPNQLRERVRDLYMLARQSVDDELQRPADALPGESAHTGHTANGHAGNSIRHGPISNGHHNGAANGTGQSNGQHPRIEVARATQSQIRAIFAIARRQGLDPHKVINDRYRVHRMEDLTIRDASALIDDLQEVAGVR
jgi:hypothetical protein